MDNVDTGSSIATLQNDQEQGTIIGRNDYIVTDEMDLNSDRLINLHLRGEMATPTLMNRNTKENGGFPGTQLSLLYVQIMKCLFRYNCILNDNNVNGSLEALERYEISIKLSNACRDAQVLPLIQSCLAILNNIQSLAK
ncbi:hypothetical protein BdWA1_001141 [Babesia duncani]|uniref:Uncharacterized protein n=1 Tax=Babesia duncani TaxID=323732 RepID=A0AAD9PNK5_9APIC|nr:hypothetical protein BdWA1_003582 [Babesia duncani]KAK2198136.1 hypothetical protein BdWA1_001141 [Babesia duncani]